MEFLSEEEAVNLVNNFTLSNDNGICTEEEFDALVKWANMQILGVTVLTGATKERLARFNPQLPMLTTATKLYHIVAPPRSAGHRTPSATRPLPAHNTWRTGHTSAVGASPIWTGAMRQTTYATRGDAPPKGSLLLLAPLEGSGLLGQAPTQVYAGPWS
jgi:hypothetical protein